MHQITQRILILFAYPWVPVLWRDTNGNTFIVE